MEKGGWTPVRRKRNNYRKKFYWHDQNLQLSAGGLLPYDENGVWLISEEKNGNVEWTDPGGKYRFEDCDIYTTIAREFNEELYCSTDLTRGGVKKLLKSGRTDMLYLNGHRNTPVYACVIAHVDDLKEAGVTLNVEKFNTRRDKTIIQNPNVPESFYSSISLEYVPYTKFDDQFRSHMSYRLRGLVKLGAFKKYGV